MSDSQRVKSFSAAIQRVFSRTAGDITDPKEFANKIGPALKPDYEAASAIVVTAKSRDFLAALMTAYLGLYSKYQANKLGVHYNRSDQLFDVLIEQTAKLTDVTLFQSWDAILAGNAEPAAFKGFRQRYAELDPHWKSLIDSFRTKQRRKTGSVLDLLRTEYENQYGSRPKSNDELYRLNPKPKADLSGVQAVIEILQTWWKNAHTDAGLKYTGENALFTGGLQGFDDAVKKMARKDLLTGFQVIKNLHDGIAAGKNEDETILLLGLYSIACVQIWGAVQNNKMYQRNRLGFLPEEIEYFMRPVDAASHVYVSNFRNIIASPFDVKHAFANRFGEVKAFLDAYGLTRHQLKDLDLVPLDKAIEIQGKWEAIREFTSQVRLASRHFDVAMLQQIFSNPMYARGIALFQEVGSTTIHTNNAQFLGKATLAAGSSVGSHAQYGEMAIVYIDPKNTNQIYVEIASLKPLLFLAHQYYINRKFYASMILEIYRGTIGAVYIVNAIFVAMGFIPVLIEEGFAGLIYEIILFYTTNKIQEQVEQINPVFAEVLGLLLQTFAPRPNLKPKVVEPPSLERDTSALHDHFTGPKNRGVQDRATAEVNRATASNGTASTGTAPRTAPSSPAKSVQQPLPQRSVANANVPQSAVLDEAAGEVANRQRGEKTAARDAETAASGAHPPRPKTAAASPVPQRPAANANVSQSMVLDEVVEEIANLQRAEESALEEEGRIAMAGGGKRGGTPPSRGRVTSTSVSGGRGKAGSGTRGTKDRGLPKPPRLYAKYKLKFGELAKLVEKSAETYKSEMARLKPLHKDVTIRSTIAHNTTLAKVRSEFEHVVHGKQRYGVSDTNVTGKLTVREGDISYHDPAIGGDVNFNAVIELKRWAYLGKEGSIRTAGGHFEEGVSSPQMQSYEILMDELGVPVFVIDERGRIYSRDSPNDAWIQVGE